MRDPRLEGSRRDACLAFYAHASRVRLAWAREESQDRATQDAEASRDDASFEKACFTDCFDPWKGEGLHRITASDAVRETGLAKVKESLGRKNRGDPRAREVVDMAETCRKECGSAEEDDEVQDHVQDEEVQRRGAGEDDPKRPVT